MTLSQAELVLALEKHGLPTYGTDAELQERYDRNNLGVPKAQAKPEPSVVVEDGNKLLSNAMAKDAPMAEVEAYKADKLKEANELNQLVKDKLGEDAPQIDTRHLQPRPTLTAFGPRKPGRPKGS